MHKKEINKNAIPYDISKEKFIWVLCINKNVKKFSNSTNLAKK